MATYPAFQQIAGDPDEWVDGIVNDRAVNGILKSRSFFTSKKRRFLFRHVLNRADAATLQTFYDTYKTTANTFVWRADGNTYTVLFGPSGVQPKKYIGSTHVELQVELLEQ